MARDESARKHRERDPLLDRRSYLRLGGLALGTFGAARLADLAAADGPAVVDVVGAGADPTGRTPIDSVLAEHAADDTLLAFPDGDYRLNGFDAAGLTNFGLVATGDAALTAPAGTRGDWLRLVDGRDVTVRGLRFRTRAADARITLRPHDGLRVRRCELTGWHAPGSRASALAVGTDSSDGRAAVERLSLREPIDESEPQVELPARLALDGSGGRYRLSAERRANADATGGGAVYDLPDGRASLRLSGPMNARFRLPTRPDRSDRAAGTPATPNDAP